MDKGGHTGLECGGVWNEGTGIIDVCLLLLIVQLHIQWGVIYYFCMCLHTVRCWHWGKWEIGVVDLQSAAMNHLSAPLSALLCLHQLREQHTSHPPVMDQSTLLHSSDGTFIRLEIQGSKPLINFQSKHFWSDCEADED